MTQSTPAATVPLNLDLDQINEQLKDASPLEIIKWACDTFGDSCVLTSSFGIKSAVMLHLCSQVKPDMKVIAIDTGYLLPETYRFANQLTNLLNLDVRWYGPRISTAHIEALHGELWKADDDTAYDKYFDYTKGEPMQRALKELGVKAWIAGLGAKQTSFRSTLRTVELQNGIYKIHPILKWASKEKYYYLKENDLPEHPLHDQGYATVGDWHSSRPVSADDTDERATRFGGKRQECGLHLPKDKNEDASRNSSGL
jgi:phosphoadenosine phosphosulfate reductase